MASRAFPALDLAWPARPTDDRLDVLLARLDDARPTAVEDTDAGLRLFFAAAADRDRALGLAGAAAPEARCRAIEVDDGDWAARSQSSLEPVRTSRFLILPDPGTPHGLEEGGGPAGPPLVALVVRPSMGFGTGHHASTRLCLELMEHMALGGRAVIDVGTGSGILALAAWRLGAGAVTAIDPDADALDAARDNARLNGAEDVLAFAPLDLDGAVRAFGDRFDLILANLTGDLIRRRARGLTALARPGGTLVLSGVLVDEAPAVTERLAACGWRPSDVRQDGEWFAARLALTAPASPTGTTAR